ncbi:MAG: thiolase family protein [Acidimicrobiia bacterium]|nr:thiolase family protein [Acidimicrobiia bacterium]
MAANPLASRAVHVIGIGLHRYQRPSSTNYIELGLTAVRAALADAGVAWPQVEAAYTGTALLGMAPSRVMLSRLGASGLAVQQVENASASGSTAVALAALEVASGRSDIVLAMGVDKAMGARMAPALADLPNLEGGTVVPFTHFALLASEYMARYDVSVEQMARVAVKNHANGARNPFAQRQKVRSLEEVLAEPISGMLTRLQCCPVGEGAAAVLLASQDAIGSLGLDRRRCPRILASVTRSQAFYPPDVGIDARLTAETTARALAEAGVSARDLDVIELHDAFSVEELLYLEAMGACAEGEAAALGAEGAWDIGGRCAVSPSGGLLAMGHPIGPTGAGQIVEITRQLRGEGGDRQQPDARLGLAHMVGVGAVCVVHVLAGG